MQDMVSRPDGSFIAIVDDIGLPSDYPLNLALPTFGFSTDAQLFRADGNQWQVVPPEQWESSLKPPINLIRTKRNVLMDVRDARGDN